MKPQQSSLENFDLLQSHNFSARFVEANSVELFLLF